VSNRNVTPGTTDSSRLAEIRARLENVDDDFFRVAHKSRLLDPEADHPARAQGIALMISDIAWLLDEVERLTARVRIYEDVKS